MPQTHTTPAYIALGSNLGDREAHIKHALAMLIETPKIQVRCISSFMENPAVGGPEDSHDFLNAAAELHTSLSPRDLMKRLLDIEKSMGRERRLKWEPRVIDLDLLLYGISIVSTDDMIVPHPLMHERKFVLQPLAEIAPNAIHPTLQVTVAGLLDGLRQGRQRLTSSDEIED